MPCRIPVDRLQPGAAARPAVWTFTAGATITGGQLLKITGNNTVSPAAAKARLCRCICPRGVFVATASGTVVAGDQLLSAAAGQVATHAARRGERSYIWARALRET